MTTPLMVARKTIMGYLLTLVFLLSFGPYLTTITPVTLLLGPIALIVLGTLVLPIMLPRRSRAAFASLTQYRFILLGLVVPIFPTMMAIGAEKWQSVYYMLLMSAVLLAVQMLLRALTIGEVIRSFTRAGVLCVVSFVIIFRGHIVVSASTASRFMPAGSQPNAIAFIFAGFVVAFAWAIASRDSGNIGRLIYGCTATIAAAVIFLASSRASMLALITAGTWGLALKIVRSAKRRQLPYSPAILYMVLIVLVAGFVLALQTNFVNTAGVYASHFLQLTSKYRGFGTGFSGRTDRWSATLHTLASSATWLVGYGYRTSVTDLGFTIDNGYLTLWYETGVLGLLFVVVQCIWLLRLCSKRYLSNAQLWITTYPRTLSAMIIVLLVNNFFDRYLFGLGNPFSLFGLFLLLVSSTDLTVAPRAG